MSTPGRAISTLPAELGYLAPFAADDMTRIGRAHDGGYMILRRWVSEVDTLISLGRSTDWSFEQHLKTLNPDIRIHAYDHTISEQLFRNTVVKLTVKSLLGMCSPRELRGWMNVLRSYRSFFSGDVKHFRERIRDRINRPDDTTLDKAFERVGSNKILLKIDIEGGEYRIIDAILRHADRMVGMVIEFHDTEPLREVFSKAVKKLQEKFEIVHLHGNNFELAAEDNLPDALELTFARREAVRPGQRRSQLPLADLDQPNDPGRADYEMRFPL